MSARRLGLWLNRTHTMVSRWERGLREPTLFDLDRLATVLHADLDTLLAGLPANGMPRGCSSRAHPRSRRVALGQVLGNARAALGLGIWEVYQATGIGGRRLGHIEAGADPAIGELVGLIELYRTTPRELLRAAKTRRRANLDTDTNPPITSRSPFGMPPDGDGVGA